MLSGLAWAAMFVSVAVMIFGVAAMMGQPVWQLELATIEAVITGTSIGWAFVVRLVLLFMAAATLMMNSRPIYANAVAASLFGFALATLPWSGHAAGSEEVWGVVHKLGDTIHLLAAGLWLGAISWFLYLIVEVDRRPGEIIPDGVLADMHRFAPLGVILVGIVGVTGLANAQFIFGVENSLAVLKTGYGALLIGKVMLVGLMLIFAARNAHFARRHSKVVSPQTGDTAHIVSQLRISLATEIALATAVIGLTAWIGTMSPMVD